MEKIKLYLLMKSLSKEDVKTARKFLDSPFHNTDPQVAKLFDCLRKFHPGMESPVLENSALFRQVFPQKRYDERKLRNLRHKLAQQLEAFLIHSTLQDEPAFSRRLLVRAYGNRNAFGLFKKEIETQLERLKKDGNRGLDYFQEMAWLHHELYFHPDTHKFKSNHPDLPAAVENLESYFTLAMLCYDAELISRQRVLKETHYFDYMEAVRKIATLRQNGQDPVTDLFVKILDLTKGGSSTFEEVTTALFKCEKRMNVFEKGMALKMLINEAIARSNRSGAAKNQSMLELYKFGLEKKLILKRSGIEPSLFINIVLAGVLAEEFEWAKHFIEQHKAGLDEPQRENTLHLCRAYWHYHRGNKEKKEGNDFEVALSELSQIPHTNEVFNLRVRPLQLRILYDSNLAEKLPLDTLLDAARNFERYLNRHSQLAGDKVEVYLNFVRWFKKLALLKNDPEPDHRQVATLHEELSQESNVAFKYWLLEKVEELEKFGN